MTLAPLENCSFLPSFCEATTYHCAKIPCTRTYECLNRKDEDYSFCNQTISQKTLERIEEIHNAYNG